MSRATSWKMAAIPSAVTQLSPHGRPTTALSPDGALVDSVIIGVDPHKLFGSHRSLARAVSTAGQRPAG